MTHVSSTHKLNIGIEYNMPFIQCVQDMTGFSEPKTKILLPPK